jgi:hypothetical protein
LWDLQSAAVKERTADAGDPGGHRLAPLGCSPRPGPQQREGKPARLAAGTFDVVVVGSGVVGAGRAVDAAARGLGGYGVLIEDLLAGIRRRLELGEVLARRTRLSIRTFDRGLAAAERRSQEQPDDEAADRRRRSVPDPYAALAT